MKKYYTGVQKAWRIGYDQGRIQSSRFGLFVNDVPDRENADRDWSDLTHLHDDDIKKFNPLEWLAHILAREIANFRGLYGKGGVFEGYYDERGRIAEFIKKHGLDKK